jgi:hypothetical protein
MEYDFLISDHSEWAHPEYQYRVIYHLGKEYNFGYAGYKSQADLQIMQDSNYTKILGYLNQMMVEDAYKAVRMVDLLIVYCNEWIDDVTLKLACGEDIHFIKPAFVEKLGLPETEHQAIIRLMGGA